MTEQPSESDAKTKNGKRDQAIGMLVLVALGFGAWWYLQTGAAKERDAQLAILQAEHDHQMQLRAIERQIQSEPPSCDDPHLRLEAGRVLAEQTGHHFKLNVARSEPRSTRTSRCFAKINGLAVPAAHEIVYYLERLPSGDVSIKFDSANEY